MAEKIVKKIVALSLSQIHADYEWNSRSGDPAQQAAIGEESEVNEFDALRQSLKARGQDQAVTVRPRKGSKDKFDLVVGFRRFRALQLNAEEAGDKNATILAEIREMSDVEAKSLNIRENTARSQLTPPDLARSLVQLRQLHIAAKGAPTVDGLATEVGVGRGYASRLISIEDKVKPDILKKWHEMPAAIGVGKMYDISKVDRDRQDELFEKLQPTAGRGTGGGGGAKAWLKVAEKEAKRVGTLLGNLERKGLIDTSELEFSEHLEDCIAMKQGAREKATDKQRNELVKLITEAFNAALQPPEAAEAEAAEAN